MGIPVALREWGVSKLQTLFSLAAADALGAATEFKTPDAIRARYGDSITTYQDGSVFGFAPGEATDDTQMVAATLLGYRKQNGLNGVVAGLRDWLATGPPDVGGLTRSALRYNALDGGVRAWADSGFQSAGNGGLMRIAAVWIEGFRGAELARESALVTALTHADPRCVFASVFFTAFLEELAAGREYRAAAEAALKVMDALEARRVLLDAELLGIETMKASQAFQKAEREARAQVRARVRSGLDGRITSQSGFVLNTLEAAIAHARADSWLACVQPAVLLGDDSDTVACVVGAIAGAKGLEVPPPLLPDLRLGHTWAGWQREWPCTAHFPGLLA